MLSKVVDCVNHLIILDDVGLVRLDLSIAVELIALGLKVKYILILRSHYNLVLGCKSKHSVNDLGSLATAILGLRLLRHWVRVFLNLDV